jgi:hypothetical protein
MCVPGRRDRRVALAMTRRIICGWIGRVILFILFALTMLTYIASAMHMPEIMNKGGASLAAIGALLVIYQAMLETRIEQNKVGDEVRLDKMTPANRDIAEKVIRQRATRRKKERIEIVIAIAVLVCVGEMLHGWGEYMYPSIEFSAPIVAGK